MPKYTLRVEARVLRWREVEVEVPDGATRDEIDEVIEAAVERCHREQAWDEEGDDEYDVAWADEEPVAAPDPWVEPPDDAWHAWPGHSGEWASDGTVFVRRDSTMRPATRHWHQQRWGTAAQIAACAVLPREGAPPDVRVSELAAGLPMGGWADARYGSTTLGATMHYDEYGLAVVVLAERDL